MNVVDFTIEFGGMVLFVFLLGLKIISPLFGG